ncbi:MAG TPA: alpha-amylase family glycosyl hydrolase [Actinomycetota bacterium]|nr:alpha-amylase family glycosyl hydrolase [Actinomycetota bacterium]
MEDPNVDTWWRHGVLYQIYVRSFRDANGDGIGDLEGVIERLDHLSWLGVDGVWLSPITRSPNLDWGYDVSDFRDVDPDLGDLTTLDRLIAEAGARGIRVVLDLVPNHTSDRHPWFVESRSSTTSPMRDRYVWAAGRADGVPPNNWRSVFGGSAWTLDERTGEYYLHNFLDEQPDLNWWNDDVRDEFEDIIRFWFDRGVAGFRIDVAHGLVKDRHLRDNPPTTEDDPGPIRRQGQRHVYSMNRPETHEILRSWRAISDATSPRRVLIGETWVFDLDALARYHGAAGDQLHLCFNFPFAFADLDASQLREIVSATELALPTDAQPAWMASNHDLGRFPTRWCDGREPAIRCALLILLTLRGTPFLYYGDEIGMTEVEVPEDRIRDTVGRRASAAEGRDRCRTPMPWTSDDGAGFSTGDAEPWLPVGDAEGRDVASQRDDPGSMLRLTRDLITLRHASDDLRAGAYDPIEALPGVWAWRRGDATTVAVNLTDRPASVDVRAGSVEISTDRAMDGAVIDGALELGAWHGVVVRAT